MHNKIIYLLNVFCISSLVSIQETRASGPNTHVNEPQAVENSEPKHSFVRFLTALHEGKKSIAGALVSNLAGEQQQAAREFYKDKFNSTPRPPAVYFMASLSYQDEILTRTLISLLPDNLKPGAIREYEEKFGKYSSQPRVTGIAKNRINNHQELMSSKIQRELEELRNLQSTFTPLFIMPASQKTHKYAHKSLREITTELSSLSQILLFDPVVDTQKMSEDITAALHQYVELTGIRDTQDQVVKTALNDLKALKMKEVEALEEGIKRRE